MSELLERGGCHFTLEKPFLPRPRNTFCSLQSFTNTPISLDYPLSLTTPNVVHMTVKPADLFDDDENTGKNAKQGAGFRRGGSRGGEPGSEEEGAGCRCVIL